MSTTVALLMALLLRQNKRQELKRPRHEHYCWSLLPRRARCPSELKRRCARNKLVEQGISKGTPLVTKPSKLLSQTADVVPTNCPATSTPFGLSGIICKEMSKLLRRWWLDFDRNTNPSDLWRLCLFLKVDGLVASGWMWSISPARELSKLLSILCE